jgi:hypothetical protein
VVYRSDSRQDGRASATAKQDEHHHVPSSIDQRAKRRRGNRSGRAHVDPTWSEAPSLRSAARGGSCTVAFLRRGVPLPNTARGHRGLADPAGPYLSAGRRRSWGSLLTLMRFAGLIPHPGGGARVSTPPGPRVVRAVSAAPIYFRRGDPFLSPEVEVRHLQVCQTG